MAADGFNPFRTMNTQHSTWPIILIPYNVPPWLCMKPSNFILSTLIPGPSSPKAHVDVFMQPLVEELKELWMNGVATYDVDRKESFQLHAAIMWTINDFPAYGDISGWSTKGYHACPCCNENKDSQYLRGSRKICYMGHRRFLPAEHHFRKQSSSFNGQPDHRPSPKRLSNTTIMK